MIIWRHDFLRAAWIVDELMEIILDRYMPEDEAWNEDFSE